MAGFGFTTATHAVCAFEPNLARHLLCSRAKPDTRAERRSQSVTRSIQSLLTAFPARGAATAVLFLAAGLLVACSDYQITSVGPDGALDSGPDSSDESTDSGPSGPSGDDSNGNDSDPGDGSDDGNDGNDDTTDSNDGNDDPSDTQPGSSPGNPRPLLVGDLVINELMIDPLEVTDAFGEYVELRNNGNAWIEFPGLRLSDFGVDDAPVVPLTDGPILIGPGHFYVICAQEDFWDNGGVPCDATIEYSTWGGGFALSNSEDEVILSSAGGMDLDLLIYDNRIVETGEAAGVDPEFSDVTGNNDLDEWCMQWGMLPFGDSGSPGDHNDTCW